MSTSKSLLSSLLMLAFATAPALAGSNDAKPANENAANTPSAAATPAEAAPAQASPSSARPRAMPISPHCSACL